MLTFTFQSLMLCLTVAVSTFTVKKCLFSNLIFSVLSPSFLCCYIFCFSYLQINNLLCLESLAKMSRISTWLIWGLFSLMVFIQICVIQPLWVRLFVLFVILSYRLISPIMLEKSRVFVWNDILSWDIRKYTYWENMFWYMYLPWRHRPICLTSEKNLLNFLICSTRLTIQVY